MPGEERILVVRLHRDASAFITHVDDTIHHLLGWNPEQLIGSPSTEFIHPQDQASAVAAWMQMIAEPRTPHSWRGRYRAADGDWVWVETQNTNLLDDAGTRAVVTEMRVVDAAGLSLEEQLRAREQLLSQLSDALPVGLVHFDLLRSIVFTNDRLHDILHHPEATDLDGLLSDVIDEDQDSLVRAADEVLTGSAVDDLELRLDIDHRRSVCSLSLRSLTDSTGEVTGAIGCVLEITDRVRLRSQLERRATTDALTGCTNRSTIIGLLDELLATLDDAPTGIAVIYIDLDEFKQINDTHGHAFGDVVLGVTVKRLGRALRSVDLLGRLGGDEFLAVCPGIDGPAAAYEIGGRVTHALQGTFSAQEATVDLRASIGVAYQATRASADSVIARADKAMYEAKRSQETSTVLAEP